MNGDAYAGRRLRSFAICIRLAALFWAAAPLATAAAPARYEAEVTAAVEALVDAYSRNDHAAYFGTFADDISIFRGPKGRWTKQDYQTAWTGVIARGGGVAKAGIADLRIQMSPAGDAAITTFLMPVKVKFPDVPPPDAKTDIVYNMTEIWFRTGRHWSLKHMSWTVQP
ncbi:MAG: hypothetical protein JWR77_1934 [Rhizorhabdus sp.]|nr:hypothetical protein [Rhizorhabdus sp.]